MRDLTPAKEREILEKACEIHELDPHLNTMESKRGPATAAETIMRAQAYKRGRPYKSSYMYCDTVDVCFYFTDSGRAVVAFTASWTEGAKDLREGTARQAIDEIDNILNTIQQLADAAPVEGSAK